MMGRLIALRAPSHGVSLFGKLPCALDFVRIHHDRHESIQLDRWLQASLQRLAARGVSWPAGYLQFASYARGSENALVGVAAASRDRAGRRFPVALYACVPRAILGEYAAALPLASLAFARRAQELLHELSSMPLSQVGITLDRLRGPGADDLAQARQELQRQLVEHTLERYVARIFKDVPLAMANEALQRVLQRRSRKGSLFDCYDCPVVDESDVAIWTRLLELSQPAAWSCLWSVAAEGGPRMLLSQSSLPERAPLYWSTPTAKHPQLCQLGGGAVGLTDRLSYTPESGNEPLATLFERLVRDL
jgi:type VI secretion system ImpM family protein